MVFRLLSEITGCWHHGKKINDIAVLKMQTPSAISAIHQCLLSAEDLVNSVRFDLSFKQSKRMTVKFGFKDHAYSNTHHTRQSSIAANPPTKSCFDETDKFFPEAKVNIVLLNYYPDGDATIPVQSDNGPEICPDTFIRPQPSF